MKPGENTTEQNRDYKHKMGSQPNNVANQWLAKYRGQEVEVLYGRQLLHTGRLLRFDLYSFEVDVPGCEHGDTTLFFKGPGVWIRKT